MDSGNRPVCEFFCQGNQLMVVTAKGQPLWKKCANVIILIHIPSRGRSWAELSSIPSSTIFIIWTSPCIIICWEPGPSGSKINADVTVDMSTTGDCCRQAWPTLWHSLVAVMASGNICWSVFYIQKCNLFIIHLPRLHLALQSHGTMWKLRNQLRQKLDASFKLHTKDLWERCLFSKSGNYIFEKGKKRTAIVLKYI